MKMRRYSQTSTSENILLLKTSPVFLSPRPIVLHRGAAVAVAARALRVVYRSVTCQSLSGDVDASPAGFFHPAGPVH